MRIVKQTWLLLLISLVLIGCGSPERKGMLKYLHHAEAMQTSLSEFQAELVAFRRVEVTQKAAAVRGWMEKVKAKHKELDGLEVPPAAKKYHAHLQAMFQTLEDYGNETLGNCSMDKLKQYSDRWAEELKGADKELSSLRA